jgi:hypothetical protein
VVLVLLALVATALAPRGARADGFAPPPPRSPSPPAGESLDELLAVVEGDNITRRSLVRELGERSSEQSPRDYERRIQSALQRRAITQVFVKAGERMGLSFPADVIDENVKDRAAYDVRNAREQAEKAKPGSGAGITLEKILAEKGITFEEYRADYAKWMMQSQYFRVLVRGIPGKRAVVDLEPSPEDVRRLYAGHTAEFDQKQGVRVALWMFPSLDFLDKSDPSAAARQKAELVVADYVRDLDAARVAAAWNVKREHVTVKGEGEWIEPAGFRLPALAAFTSAENLKPGDSTIVEDPSGGSLALVVLAVRPARVRTFEEVQAELIARIQRVRMIRFEQQHTIELLSRAQIWPPALAGDLEADARRKLQELDKDPINRDIRLR